LVDGSYGLVDINKMTPHGIACSLCDNCA